MATNAYSERFLQVIDKLGVTDYFIWNNCDAISKAQMSHIRTGKGGASLSIIESLCNNFPQVNANYILTGKEPMFIESENSVSTEEGKGNDNDISLTYDELSRLYKTTVSRYERLFTNLEEQFKGLEKTIMEVRENLDNALDDVRVVLNKKETA